MIKNKTVLVLGAGASMPFGFPSGYDLKVQITEQLNPKNASEMRSQILAAPLETNIVDEFWTALDKSGRRSVDAFLEHRVEFLEVGKMSIACALLPREQERRLFETREGNWYEYLFNKLNARFEDLSQNALAVITFNYDRSLEQYLLTALRNSYGKSQEECAEAVRSIPLVHVYGQLGDLPSLAGHGIKYDEIITPTILREAARGIRIIHENVSSGPNFDKLHELMREAQRICFIGFGYDNTNLERLFGGGVGPLRDVFGSAKGLSEQECVLIKGKLRTLGCSTGIALLPAYGDALDFLHYYCPLD